jgi:hypothetical protein
VPQHQKAGCKTCIGKWNWSSDQALTDTNAIIELRDVRILHPQVHQTRSGKFNKILMASELARVVFHHKDSDLYNLLI